MIGWINERFGVQLAEKDVNQVKNFSLIWNIFEDTVCDRYCTIPKMKAAFQNKNFNLIHFEVFLDYFKQRYVENGQPTEKFPGLRITNENYENLVLAVLKGKETTERETVLALAIIVYRYRNNLFHGEKDIRTINLQNDNFQNANGFLQALLTNYFN